MTTDAVGGVFTYALALMQALEGRCTFDVAILGPAPDASQRARLAALPHVRLHARAYALEWMEDPWEDVAASARWLLELERELAPRVIHLNGYAQAAAPFHAPVLIVAHSCVLSWWRAVHGEEAPANWDPYRDAVGQGLRAADAVVAPTRAMLDALVSCHGPVPAPSVIPNAPVREGTVRVNEKEARILGAGRLWDAAKNLAVLEAAAPGLGAPVEVAGPIPDRPVKAISLLGQLDAEALGAHYAKAGIFAHPARYEPFGLAVLEAAQHGCALVLGDIPSLRENWEGAARFVAPDDVEGWHAALAELLGDPAARRALGRSARERAGHFDATSMSAAYLRLYGQLALQGRQNRPGEVHACASSSSSTH